MHIAAPIARFTADDLAQAPALIDGVVGTVLTQLTRADPQRGGSDLAVTTQLAPALARVRQRMVADYHTALMRSLTPASAAPATSARPGERPDPRPLLMLVDERAVVADVETARIAEAIRSAADHELRELGAFLATLAGEPEVSRHHLALSPEMHARALWAAARQLAADGPLPIAFMHHATAPLAAALRRHWAAACTRLEDAGIVPAAYRTIIIHGGVRVDPQAPPPLPTRRLRDIDQALGVIEHRLAVAAVVAASTPAEPPATTPEASGRSRLAPLADAAPAPSPRIDAVGHIFDALQTDRRVAPDFKPALARLRDAALAAAAADAALADHRQHPLWDLVDRIAWQGQVLPAPPQRERVRTMQVVNGLVDQLAREAQPGAARFEWALERLVVLEHNRLERRIKQHQQPIAALQAVERQLAAARLRASADAGPGDVAQLPTVPATLYDSMPGDLAQGTGTAAWIDHLTPGDMARLQIDGQWVLAQLLWRGPAREVWLWAQCTGEAIWPVRRGALSLLHQGRLAVPAEPGGVVREVAHELSRRATSVFATA